MEIRCFSRKKMLQHMRTNVCSHARRENAFFLSVSCSDTHMHTQTYTHTCTHTVAPAIYSHLSHTGKCIHVLRAPISLLCLSIFSHTHSPKQSPSITTPLHFSPSLSLFIFPFSTVNHSFPFPPSSPLSLSLPTYISLLYHPLTPLSSVSISLFFCQSFEPWGVLR